MEQTMLQVNYKHTFMAGEEMILASAVALLSSSFAKLTAFLVLVFMPLTRPGPARICSNFRFVASHF